MKKKMWALWFVNLIACPFTNRNKTVGKFTALRQEAFYTQPVEIQKQFLSHMLITQ